MRDRMNSATSNMPKFDNQAVGRAFHEVAKRESKNPISVRTPGGTVSLKPRTAGEVAGDFAKAANNRRKKKTNGG